MEREGRGLFTSLMVEALKANNRLQLLLPVGAPDMWTAAR
jgi:hypothetical protein